MCKKINADTVRILTLIQCLVSVSAYNIDLWSDGPIVRGGQIIFTAVIYENDNHAVATGSFKYSWIDNAIPAHSKESESSKGIDSWVVTYNATTYAQGSYVAQVTICKLLLAVYCYGIGSKRIEFNITETLNGELALLQKNATRGNGYVSNADTVIHNVTLKKTDAEFLKKAPTVLTYWFVDCTYYGFRNDLIFPFNYTKPDESHFVEALVVGDFTPLPPPTTVAPTTTTTTTTIKPNSTTVAPTTVKPNTTTTAPVTKPTTVTPKTVTTVKTVVKRDVGSAQNKSQIMVMVNGTLVPYVGTFPYVCNSTTVATDPNKTYGYFSRKVQVKAPVANVNVTGNNWLQHGELLTLNVKCRGSKNLNYCVNYMKGVYNVTGNETCEYPHELETCEFTIQHYLIESMEHTIIIIIQNEVGKKVVPVTVTVYKAKKQAQLSVIVVPVAFSLVAVVLIVFGVAYYIQNRSRFVVEVADFNFGQNYSDMEYKTFRERLRDSITNALFTRAPSPGSSEVPVWPPGRKYGSMTS